MITLPQRGRLAWDISIITITSLIREDSEIKGEDGPHQIFSQAAKIHVLFIVVPQTCNIRLKDLKTSYSAAIHLVEIICENMSYLSLYISLYI